MNILFQDYEVSKRIFRSAYQHPEGKKLEYRKLTQDFWFIIDGSAFTIKKGFWWDGASIPRILWTAVGDPWEADIAPGALIHDMLYACQYYQRWKADLIMFEVNKLNGMNAIKNHAVYRALRIGGWKAWNDKTDEMIKGASKHLVINV